MVVDIGIQVQIRGV